MNATLTVITQALETILIQNNPIYKSFKVLPGKQQEALSFFLQYIMTKQHLCLYKRLLCFLR